MQGKTRVVVTGYGLISPLALNADMTWQRLTSGQSGIKRINTFDATSLPCQIAGLVEGFDLTDFGYEAKSKKKMDSFIQYGCAAAEMALSHANLVSKELDLTRVGVSIGSGIGGLPLIEQMHSTLLNDGPRRVSPFFIPGAIINMISGFVSIRHGFEGPTIACATACTTGVHSIGLGARMIQSGDADVMVVGGAEKASTPLGIAGFSALKALSTRNDEPEKASRPWDQSRDGFVLGDGAGVLVIESLEHAQKRGAPILAEIVGFGMSSDAYHMTSPAPEGRGQLSAMKHALRDAGISPSEIGYVNAHATSTPAGDEGESHAIKSCFGDAAANVLVSSTKSMTGHLLGAAGAIESIFTIQALTHQVVPPTINLTNPSPGCDLDYVANEAREATLRYAMSNSFGFGGTNGVLIFKQPEFA